MPNTHALYPQIRKAVGRYINSHKSPLHEIFHQCKINPDRFETIKPSLWGPKWRPSHEITISKGRKEAEQTHDNYKGCHVVYSDGSGRDGKIGAAAVYKERNGRWQTRRKLLGEASTHTVYEAELVGIHLALDIAKGIRYTSEVVIMADNQAAIKATTHQKASPGQQLVESIQKAIEELKKKRGIAIKIVWVPGHQDIEGNKKADKEAEKAINEGDSNCEHLNNLHNILTSRSAVRQQHEQELKSRARQIWENSPRYLKMREIDESLPSKNYTKMIDKLPRKSSAILTQLRTGHAPLNYFLHKITRSDDLTCQACGMEAETVRHFLTRCPRFDSMRIKLQQRFRQRELSTKTLLLNPKTLGLLFGYINETRRFYPTYGTFAIPNVNKGRRSRRKERRE